MGTRWPSFLPGAEVEKLYQYPRKVFPESYRSIIAAVVSSSRIACKAAANCSALAAIVSAVSSMVSSPDRKLPGQPDFISSLFDTERDLYVIAAVMGIESNKTVDVHLSLQTGDERNRGTSGTEEDPKQPYCYRISCGYGTFK